MTIKEVARKVLKPFVPRAALRWRDRVREIREKRAATAELDRMFAGKDPQSAFALIYERGMWGKGTEGDFYSGAGSHEPAVVDAYVHAVSRFLGGLPSKPDVVDLGCGDFNVGAKLRSFCGSYLGCDVVQSLIERNATRFSHLGVDFLVLDITSEPVPACDVVFVRQVLQHLSNAQILNFLANLPACRYLLVTEHHPAAARFVPNRDKPIGAGTRMDRHDGKPSGVVLTAPPFNLAVTSQQTLCEVEQYGGVIRTILYEMRLAGLAT